jgi:hypothetical protein
MRCRDHLTRNRSPIGPCRSRIGSIRRSRSRPGSIRRSHSRPGSIRRSHSRPGSTRRRRRKARMYSRHAVRSSSRSRSRSSKAALKAKDNYRYIHTFALATPLNAKHNLQYSFRAKKVKNYAKLYCIVQ